MKVNRSFRRGLLLLFALALPGLAGNAALGAEPGSDAVLVTALRNGGLVILMRHASSPRELPDAASTDPGNAAGERQLDDQGRAAAAAFGAALRRLALPVTEVGSSPAFRVRQTAMLAGFAQITIRDELGNEGMSDSSGESAAWLQAEAARQVIAGNRLLITHGPNIAAAFPAWSEDMEEGEALVLAPAGSGGPQLVARVKIGEWPLL